MTDQLRELRKRGRPRKPEDDGARRKGDEGEVSGDPSRLQLGRRRCLPGG
jgi:hypothetical protein